MCVLRIVLATWICLNMILEKSDAGITLDQMMDAGKLMRQSCQPKFKISDDIADGIRDGKIPDTKDVKCYINCILEMTKTMKKGKYQLELGLRQIELMVPDDMKKEYTNAFLECKDVGSEFKNPCDISFAVLKCFYSAAPRFVFP